MSTPGPIRKAWLRWKTLRLPWRKKYLVGLDLQGNTFWEFKDVLSSKQGRMRRIVQYPNTVHYSDVSGKITPAWHQWLRHTRQDPPSLTEQSQDLVRQRNLKLLAAQADARWAAKPSFLDAPGRRQGQPLPPLAIGDSGGYGRDGRQTESVFDQSAESPAAGGLDGVRQASGHQSGEGVGKEEEHQQQQQEEKEEEEPHPADRAAATLAESKKTENPWKKKASGASETWQPQAWTPGGVAPRRR